MSNVPLAIVSKPTAAVPGCGDSVALNVPFTRVFVSVVNVTGTGIEGASPLAPPKEPDPVPAMVTPYVLK